MTEPVTSESAFITYLASLAVREDRAALAALRRGLGRAPGMAPELYPYVVRFFSGQHPTRENAMFTVAALFGMHPSHRRGAGSPLLALNRLNLESTSTERRVLALLNADATDLPTHLRHLFSLIHSHGPEFAIDYDELVRHVASWDASERWVQRRWARDWWAASVPDRPDNETTPADVDDEEGAA